MALKRFHITQKSLGIGLLLIIPYFVYLFLFTDYPKHFFSKIYLKEITWVSNENFGEQTDLYKMYASPKNIVMLGTSQTYRVDWNELTGRSDIANRGIDGDITAGFLERLNFVFQLQPKVCFIEGGINDLRFGATIEIASKNLETIVNKLQKHQITPVLTTVAFVGNNFPDAQKFNHEINMLNALIQATASSKKIRLLDLNKILSENGFLNPSYARADGIHLNSSAYLLWKNEVLKIIGDLAL